MCLLRLSSAGICFDFGRSRDDLYVKTLTKKSAIVKKVKLRNKFLSKYKRLNSQRMIYDSNDSS